MFNVIISLKHDLSCNLCLLATSFIACFIDLWVKLVKVVVSSSRREKTGELLECSESFSSIDHDLNECLKADPSSSDTLRGSPSSSSLANDCGLPCPQQQQQQQRQRSHKIGRSSFIAGFDRDQIVQLSRLTIAIIMVVVQLAIHDPANFSKVFGEATSKSLTISSSSLLFACDILGDDDNETSRQKEERCASTNATISTQIRRYHDDGDLHHYLTPAASCDSMWALALTLLAFCGASFVSSGNGVGFDGDRHHNKIRRQRPAVLWPLLLVSLAAAAAAAATRGQLVSASNDKPSSIVVLPPSEVKERNPYAGLSTNSTKNYLERHIFGLRIQQPGQSDYIISGDQMSSLIASRRQEQERQLQEMNDARANKSRSERSASSLPVTSNRQSRIVRHLNSVINSNYDGLGRRDNRSYTDNYSGDNATTTGLTAASWLLASDDYDGNGGQVAANISSKDQQAAASLGKRRKSIINLISSYNNNNNSSTSANNTANNYKRDYETTHLGFVGGRAIGNLPLALQQPARRDFITNFLSQLPGLSALTKAATRQPSSSFSFSSSSNSSNASFASKLAAKLRNTTASTTQPPILSGHIYNGSYPVVAYSLNSTNSKPEAGDDWLNVQASDNIEQVIHTGALNHQLLAHHSHQDESKAGNDKKTNKGEHLRGYEQEGNWKKEKQGEERLAGGANKQSKEGAKNLDDKGHNKHGWKNVYHREEYAQHSKFHDLFRDKNWDHSKGNQLESKQFNKGEKFNSTQAKDFHDIDKHGTKYDYSKGTQWKRYEDTGDDNHQDDASYEGQQMGSGVSPHHQHEGELVSGSVNRFQNSTSASTGSNNNNNDDDESAADEGDNSQPPSDSSEAIIEQMKAKLDHLSNQQQQFAGEPGYSLPGERLRPAQQVTSVYVPAARNIKDILKIPSGKSNQSRKLLNGSSSSNSAEVADLGDYGGSSSGGDGDDTSGGSGDSEAANEKPVAKENRKNELRLKLELDLGKSINRPDRSKTSSKPQNYTSPATTMLPLLQNTYARVPQEQDYLSKGKKQIPEPDGWSYKPSNGVWKPKHESNTKYYHSNYSGPAPMSNDNQQYYHHPHERQQQHQYMPLKGNHHYGGTNHAQTGTNKDGLKSKYSHSKPSRGVVMMGAASLARSMPNRPIIVKHLQMNGGIVMGRVSAASNGSARNRNHVYPGVDSLPLIMDQGDMPLSAEDSFASSLADHDEILEHLPASKHALYDMSYEPAPKSPVREYVISFERDNKGDGHVSESLHRYNLRRPPSQNLQHHHHHHQLELEQAEPNIVFEASPSELAFERKPFSLFADNANDHHDLPSSQSAYSMMGGESSSFEGYHQFVDPEQLGLDNYTSFRHNRRPSSSLFVDGSSIQLEPMLMHESRSHHSIPLRDHNQHEIAMMEASDRRRRQRLLRQNSNFVDLLRVAPSNYTSFPHGSLSSHNPQTIPMHPSSQSFSNHLGTPVSIVSPQAIFSRLLRLPRVLGVLQNYQAAPFAMAPRPTFLAPSLSNRGPNLPASGGDLVVEASHLIPRQVKPPLQWQKLMQLQSLAPKPVASQYQRNLPSNLSSTNRLSAREPLIHAKQKQQQQLITYGHSNLIGSNAKSSPFKSQASTKFEHLIGGNSQRPVSRRNRLQVMTSLMNRTRRPFTMMM